MISSNELRNLQLTQAENGYSIEEVNSALDTAADTIDAYQNESKELYRKMEVLAAKIEEYRKEEDSIKAALITAQKMSDKITNEAQETADRLTSEAEAGAKAAVDDANAQAEKIVSEAREYASTLVKEKNDEAAAVIADAEKKANDAINSSKIVAQNILDQAEEISKSLIEKSKEEKEAYELLNAALKKDAAEFISKLKELYGAQLDALNSAKLDADIDEQEEAVDKIQNEVDSLVSEIDEIKDAIPEKMTIELDEVEAPAAEEETDSIDDEPEYEEEENEEEASEFAFETLDDDEEEEVDAKAAVEAFSQDTITPVDDSARAIPVIDASDDDSLFSEDEKLPFENYFHVNKSDPHLDKTQTISLVPPEDYDEGDDDEPKFKGFFKKKK